MSKIVSTKLGRFRQVIDGTAKWWLWECPDCKTWGRLSLDQMEGRVSVVCGAPKIFRHEADPADNLTGYCNYHQTHEYAEELVTTIQARVLMDENPYEEESGSQAA